MQKRKQSCANKAIEILSLKTTLKSLFDVESTFYLFQIFNIIPFDLTLLSNANLILAKYFFLEIDLCIVKVYINMGVGTECTIKTDY